MRNRWQSASLENARDYDQRKEEGPHHVGVAIKRRVLGKLIQAHVPADPIKPILDLGGGTGAWAVPLAAAGRTVVLGDISPGFLSRAREKLAEQKLLGQVVLHELDICDLSRFSEKSFSLILALGDPLSYCADAERALREMRRVISDDGLLIADVENRYAGLDERRAPTLQDAFQILGQGLSRGSEPASDLDPIRLFLPAEIEPLLKRTNWSLEKMYGSDLLAAFLRPELLRELKIDSEDFESALAIEEELRNDPHTLGLGSEIQFVARPL